MPDEQKPGRPRRSEQRGRALVNAAIHAHVVKHTTYCAPSQHTTLAEANEENARRDRRARDAKQRLLDYIVSLETAYHAAVEGDKQRLTKLEDIVRHRERGMSELLPALIENAEGVHVVSPLTSEYTLCGDAWDIDQQEGASHTWRAAARPTVTCQRCAMIIYSVRNVHVSRHRAARPSEETR